LTCPTTALAAIRRSALSRKSVTKIFQCRQCQAVPEILAAAPGAWRVVELDSCATDVFGALAESRAYLDGLGEAA